MALFQQLLHLQTLALPLQVSLKRLSQLPNNHDLELLLVELEHGLEFNQALDALQQHYDPLGLQLLKLASQAQTPVRGLELYIQQIQLKSKIIQKIWEESFYPLLLLALSFLIGIIFQTQVRPAYQGLTQAFGIAATPSLTNFPRTIPFLIGILSLLWLAKKNLPWSIKYELDWLSWFNMMSLAGHLGLNFPQALDFSLPYIQGRSIHAWHGQLKENLNFGEFKFSLPPHLPKAVHPLLTLISLTVNWTPIFEQAANVIQYEIETKIARLGRYLQPLLLFLISMGCGCLIYIIYTPLFHLSESML